MSYLPPLPPLPTLSPSRSLHVGWLDRPFERTTEVLSASTGSAILDGAGGALVGYLVAPAAVRSTWALAGAVGAMLAGPLGIGLALGGIYLLRR